MNQQFNWTIKTPRRVYSLTTRQLILERIPKHRLGVQKFVNYETVDHDNLLYLGKRFYSDDTILVAIESNFAEVVFLENFDRYICDAVYQACEADYYYSYVKEY